MDSIVFARTRWNYESYTDFWKLVELSDYPTCYVDEMNLGDASTTYIFTPMNGEYRPFVRDFKTLNGAIKANVLWWNLERPTANIAEYEHGYRELIGDGMLSNMIVSDAYLAEQVGCLYIPMGSHVGLGSPGDLSDKAYDIIHLSCYSNHRSMLFHTPIRPKETLYGYTVANNGWGQQRHDNLRRSRIMLNIHQDGLPCVEPLRFALAAAYGLPVLSETVHKSIYAGYTILMDMGHLSDSIRFMIDNYAGTFYNSGLQFREAFALDKTFKTLLEEYI